MPIEPFLGQIMMFAGNFAPKGWALCNGQLLAINDNQALFSLLGTTYGGDGVHTFALPNLQGRVAIGSGQGPGLSDYALGELVGSETVTLTEATTPEHDHGVEALHGPTSGTSATPVGEQWAYSATPAYASSPNGSGAPLPSYGGGQPHENWPPYLVITHCIALSGIYPSRN